jgi:hypothetical protein
LHSKHIEGLPSCKARISAGWVEGCDSRRMVRYNFYFAKITHHERRTKQFQKRSIIVIVLALFLTPLCMAATTSPAQHSLTTPQTQPKETYEQIAAKYPWWRGWGDYPKLGEQKFWARLETALEKPGCTLPYRIVVCGCKPQTYENIKKYYNPPSLGNFWLQNPFYRVDHALFQEHLKIAVKKRNLELAYRICYRHWLRFITCPH